MRFEYHVDEEGVTLTPENKGILSRILGERTDLTASRAGDASLLLALGDLAAAAEESPDSVQVASQQIWLSHNALAALDARTARTLSLPPFPDLTFSTDVRSTVGNRDFKLTYRWLRDGKTEPVSRTGAILHTAVGDRRIPATILGAIDLADRPPGESVASQWNALARFRSSLLGEDADAVGQIAMTDFLSKLEVHLASGFSIIPRPSIDGLDFEIGAHEARDEDAELVPVDPVRVAQRIRERGALPAYRLATGSYLVVDEVARPVLEVVTGMQRAAPKLREAFVRNPLPWISEAIEKDLEAKGRLNALGDADRQREIESATSAFVELSDYADRVAGIGEYTKPDLGLGPTSGITWLPEAFGPELVQSLNTKSIPELEVIKAEAQAASQAGETTISVDGRPLPTDPLSVSALAAEIERRRKEEFGDEASLGEVGTQSADAEGPRKPQILQPGENFDEVAYAAQFRPRPTNFAGARPRLLKSTLHPHQEEGLIWAREAWRQGLPGVLNADEQGLGKTLQSIAFLAWLQECLEQDKRKGVGPILVVAPTSLLENWEAEVEQHLHRPGMGALIRLYGSSLSAFRRPSMRGRDTDDAADHLDMSVVHQAIEEGRAHRMWMLTTYQTLTNYQHSLGRIRFSAIVFDEIQALKNPGTLAAKAAKAMNSDFRIGLTGTPVENSIDDLWAIMDQLAPGYLGALNQFRVKFQSAQPTEVVLTELHRRVFDTVGGMPPLGLRRMKREAASYLPDKRRFLHPREMPDVQAKAYETARIALAGGGLGAMLKMLHRIRGVSLHPDPSMDDGFEEASARLSAGLDILDRIAGRGERALIFIEDRRMQHRFVALARARYDLDRIDVINGSTPIRQRKTIVDRFQALSGSSRFGLLVLGPRAAGTGLTLTAATHVIHLSRWWNPAVEEQCNDRVHRIGQDRPVSIHLPMALHPRYGLGSFDCQLQVLMERKRRLASQTLFPAGESPEDVERLRNAITQDETVSGRRGVEVVMDELLSQIGVKAVLRQEDGSYAI